MKYLHVNYLWAKVLLLTMPLCLPLQATQAQATENYMPAINLYNPADTRVFVASMSGQTYKMKKIEAKSSTGYDFFPCEVPVDSPPPLDTELGPYVCGQLCITTDSNSLNKDASKCSNFDCRNALLVKSSVIYTRSETSGSVYYTTQSQISVVPWDGEGNACSNNNVNWDGPVIAAFGYGPVVTVTTDSGGESCIDITTGDYSTKCVYTQASDSAQVSGVPAPKYLSIPN